MRAALALWRLLRVSLHLLHGMAVMTRFPRLAEAERVERIRWWSGKVLRLLGLEVGISGAPHPGATLLVANHVSWLDIAAIHAAAPHVRFVSKADVLRWPLLGWLIRNAGTLFIERERKRDAMRVVHAVAAALQQGQTIGVFPEGTTGAGAEPLPFHANLLQAAVATATPVQAAVLRFHDPHARFSEAVHFLGETTLVQSMWRVASARDLGVRITLLPAVESAATDRRALASHLHDLIAASLRD
ncbi:1-acyl-sn-glycerol-3-phosphate acyltransferase [Rubrivivax sp. A210]|uniref:lysophospholipid acyltransferase family protein n=1 Tax=Rubrivivax sp. A210 TaxID=2772301 RepID=UPI001919C221|nr:lysophospholipid acyltransferase family protein [Rubrivivax sp. A210]CAD5372680.1 1-acyl-sn-glycerol-3-phosphate acyltransferase [Rubrivivax sp. A210]